VIPQRYAAGAKYLALGFDFAFMNQMRDRTKPTWMAGFEARFGVGEPMHACNANPAPGQLSCANFSDVNRNGTAGDANGVEEGNFARGDRPAGVTRGTTGLELHSFISRRIKYIEPYAGFRALFEFQNQSSDFGQTDLQGSLVNHPPLEGWMILGLQIIPWENREAFQRFAIDVRATGSYRSEGREYSELFDALGSSRAETLRRPNASNWGANLDPATNTPTADTNKQPPSISTPTD
jgi:hypothetical protein